MTIAGITIDYSIIWLAAVIILAVIEAATMGLTSIWFAGGAFAAAIAALLGGSLPIQIIVFLCSFRDFADSYEAYREEEVQQPY